jgi:CheY-like chemotaxis protein
VALGLLARLGAEVVCAHDGRQAIEQLAGNDVDLVLMDVQMPAMDGVQATAAIRGGASGQARASVPIIAMTAHAMAGEKERLLAAGMNDYLAKPVSATSLPQPSTGSWRAGTRPGRTLWGDAFGRCATRSGPRNPFERIDNPAGSRAGCANAA